MPIRAAATARRDAGTDDAVRIKSLLTRVRSVTYRVLVYAGMIAVSFVLVLPLLWLFAASLKTPQLVAATPRGIGEFFATLAPTDPHFENYVEALTKRPFGLWARNTSIIVIAATVGTLLTGSMAAYAFARLRFRGKRTLFTITLSTLMLPFIVTMIPQFLMFARVPGPSSAGNWTDTLWPLILPHWFGGGAFFIFLMRQFFMTVPVEMDEAARIDGAGFFRCYWQITLPLSGPVLATVTIFSFISNWNDFLAPLIYLASRQNQTLALGLQSFRGEFQTDYHLLMAASATMTVPVLLVFFFMQRYFLKGFVMSGIAGR